MIPCQKCPSSLCPWHETPQNAKIHTKLGGYGQQKTALPRLADGSAGLKQDSIQHLRRIILTPKLPLSRLNENQSGLAILKMFFPVI